MAGGSKREIVRLLSTATDQLASNFLVIYCSTHSSVMLDGATSESVSSGCRLTREENLGRISG